MLRKLLRAASVQAIPRLGQHIPKFSFGYKEVLDYQKEDMKAQQKITGVNCLVLHPVFYPNKGPEIELYLAEEAVGLAKSLYWSVRQGPFWRDQQSGAPQSGTRQTESNPGKQSQPGHVNASDDSEIGTWSTVKEAGVVDGDYVYSPAFKGIYYQNGLFVDLSSDSEDLDLYDEWKNKLLRTSIAKSSLMRVRKITYKNFLTKGKVLEIGKYIARNSDINAVFINTELTSLQIRNLEKHFGDIHQGNINTKYFKSVNPATLTSDSESETEEYVQNLPERPIKVFDRFTIILQIFAKRAKTQISRLQIELSFLQFLKTKLIRDGGTTFSALFNIFTGDLMQAKEIRLEIIKAKQKGIKGQMAGEGESQLEIERRVISDKESKIRKQLALCQQQRKAQQQKKLRALSSIPSIAIIGYTNAGKSALMNAIMKTDVVASDDLLFQTLHTTQRQARLTSGLKVILMDTIGFITNLPHELVESFKSTLEEVQHADLVLHVRDISHPQTEQQKLICLKVLKEIGFDQKFYTQKMIEVWNKIDLMTQPMDYDKIEKQDQAIVPISALHKINIDKLMNLIEEKISLLKGKQMYTLLHSIADHPMRIKWLKEYGNEQGFIEEEYDYTKSEKYPYGSVLAKVYLDDVTYKRYQQTFNLYSKEKLKKFTPPEDWKKFSKSYFERKKTQIKNEDY